MNPLPVYDLEEILTGNLHSFIGHILDFFHLRSALEVLTIRNLSFTSNSFKTNESDYRLFSIYRFNPAKDCKPHMESYAVNIKE